MEPLQSKIDVIFSYYILVALSGALVESDIIEWNDYRAHIIHNKMATVKLPIVDPTSTFITIIFSIDSLHMLNVTVLLN